MLVYLPIFIFAILEGEAYYSIQCTLAMNGQLRWLPVLVAGALGGAAGDQFWFYLLRGRVHWLERYPKIARYQHRVTGHVQAHEALIILASRFLPGLRTAIPAACAFAEVPRIKFSVLNLISAFAWAGGIMLFVKGGAKTLTAFGLNAWWGPFIPAGMLVLFVFWLSRPPRASANHESTKTRSVHEED
jgi:membrane protein DedA with SNARE-associated domain